MDVDVDVVMDVDKPGKGGWQGKMEKKGGKSRKRKREEEKQAEGKKYVFDWINFFGNLIGFARLLLEKNGPSPESKAKEMQYI